MSNYLIVTEGRQDIGLISKTLMLLGFTEIKNKKNVKEEFQEFIPKSFPFHLDGQLNIFNQVPFFLKKEDDLIIILGAGGETKILEKLESTLNKSFKLLYQLTKIILFFDGDNFTAEEKNQWFLEEINSKGKKLQKEDFQRKKIKVNDLIEIDITTYIFPNNYDKGRIEDILFQLIKQLDSILLDKTITFLEDIPNEYKEKWNDTNAIKDKTIISCLGSIKNPGAGSAVYIKDSNWISPDTLSNENLKTLYEFLEKELS